MQSISRHWMVSAAFSVLGTCGITTQVGAEPSTQILIDHNDRCTYFYTNCSGTQNKISITFKKNSGETKYGITQFSEQDDKTFVDETLRLGKVGSLRGTAKWNMQIDGVKFDVKKQFYLGENAGVRFGAYLGKIKAAVNLNAQISLQTNPFSIHVPAIHIPAVEELGIVERDRPAQRINIPAMNRTLIEYPRGAAASLPYGGLTLDSGYGYPISSRITGIVGQNATVGFDGIRGSLNAGVILSSSAGHNTRAPMGNVCEGETTFPAQGINFMVNICASKVFKDPLYEAARKKAGELGVRAGEYFSHAADRIEDKTNYRPSTPTYSAEQVLDLFGLESRYEMKQSLLASFAVRSENMAYAVTVEQSLSGSEAFNVKFALGYEFK